MTFNPDIHHRRSIRLQDYDYASAGAYFVTICSQGRENLFGRIDDDTMVRNDAGRMLEGVWSGLPERFPGIELDAFVVMPNHVHGIIMFPARRGDFVFDRNLMFPRMTIRAITRIAPTVRLTGLWDGYYRHSNPSPPMNIRLVSNNLVGNRFPANYGSAIITNGSSAMRKN